MLRQSRSLHRSSEDTRLIFSLQEPPAVQVSVGGPHESRGSTGSRRAVITDLHGQHAHPEWPCVHPFCSMAF